jgi:hypothetical protein
MDRKQIRLAQRLADPIDHDHALTEFEATFEDNELEPNCSEPDPQHLFVPNINIVIIQGLAIFILTLLTLSRAVGFYSQRKGKFEPESPLEDKPFLS